LEKFLFRRKIFPKGKLFDKRIDEKTDNKNRFILIG
jgi:hypothetical protein